MGALLSAPAAAAAAEYGSLPAASRLALLQQLTQAASASEAVTAAAEAQQNQMLEMASRADSEAKEARRAAKRGREEWREGCRAELVRAARKTAPKGEKVTDVDDAQVTALFSRLVAAEACGGVVAVMSRASLEAAETELAVTLELKAGGVGVDGYALTARLASQLSARRDEMRRRRDTLRGARDAATAELKAAVQRGVADEISEALQAARDAALEGNGDADAIGPGGRWMTVEVRDAYIALHDARGGAADSALAAAKQAELEAMSGRTEPLGVDRRGRRYWALRVDGGVDGDDGDDAVDATPLPTVWVEPPPGAVRRVERAPAKPSTSKKQSKKAKHEAKAEERAAANGVAGGGEDGEDGEWQRYVGGPAVASLAASLDVRGVREQALQAALMKLLER